MLVRSIVATLSAAIFSTACVSGPPLSSDDSCGDAGCVKVSPQAVLASEPTPKQGCDDDSDCNPGHSCNNFQCLKAASPELAGSNPEPPICDSTRIEYSIAIPNVALLVDRSGSMGTKISGNARWDVLKNILIGDDDEDGTDDFGFSNGTDRGLVGSFEKEVRFSFNSYTGKTNQCPYIGGMMDQTAFQLNNYEAIRELYAPMKYISNGDTPTGESLTALVDHMKTNAPDGPKWIVLATDGEPDTCEYRSSTSRGYAASIAAAEYAYQNDIRLIVISVGNGVAVDHLQDLANIGMGLDVNSADEYAAPYFQALTQDDLRDAFREAIQSAKDCSVDLSGTLTESAMATGTVTIGGESIAIDPLQGYSVEDRRTMLFHGTACTKLRQGAPLEVNYPCGSFIPSDE